MYGTDMADALFQTIHAGYSGCIAWMLDDAMHFKEAPDKLKIWGFWNIFGDEIFGAGEERVRRGIMPGRCCAARCGREATSSQPTCGVPPGSRPSPP